MIERDLAELQTLLSELTNALRDDEDDERWETARSNASDMIRKLETMINRIDEGNYG
jgi:hypothetical protein